MMHDESALLADEIRALRRRMEALERLETPRLNRGAAFPAGWPTNLPFYRTDLGRWCYYDGSRWLTVHEYQISLPAVNASASPVSATYAANRTDYAPYVSRVTMATNVAATNNGSNYWTVNVRGINGAFTTGATVYGRNTSADTAGAWAYVGSAPSTPNPADYAFWEVQGTKTGSPGSLTVTAAIIYRLIVT